MREERGIMVVWIAVLALALIILTSFGLDTGWMTFVRNQAQVAVDSAALAGAAGIPAYNFNGDRAQVDLLAQSFNGPDSLPQANTVMQRDAAIQGEDVALKRFEDGEVSDEADIRRVNAVQVTKQYVAPLFFAQVFRENTQRISVSATAVLNGPSCEQPDVPISLIDCDKPGGLPVCQQLKCDIEYRTAVASNSLVDNMAWIAPEGERSTGNKCRQQVRQGIDTPICVDDRINLNNGEIASCFQALANECTARGCSSANPWKVVVPVLDCNDFANGNPNQTAPVRGYAKVGIVKVEPTASPKSITFKLICGELSNSKPGRGGKNCGFYSAPTLVK